MAELEDDASASTAPSSRPPIRPPSFPSDILVCIAERLTSYADLLRFSAVCRAWRSAVTDKYFRAPRQMPWLMLAENSDPEARDVRSFYSLSEHRIYKLPLPVSSGISSCGSVDGWVVTVGADQEIHLQNPFTRRSIQLPSLRTFETWGDDGMEGSWMLKNGDVAFVENVCLSSHPSDDSNFIAVALQGKKRSLAYARLDDRVWTSVKSEWSMYTDTVFYEGRFYAVSYTGDVVVLNIERGWQVEKVADRPAGLRYGKRFLVESSGKLLQLVPISVDGIRIREWMVFKLDIENGKLELVESLGDQAIFLDPSSSMSVSADGIPGCRSNYVYLAYDGQKIFSYSLEGKRMMGLDIGRSVSGGWVAPSTRWIEKERRL